jgi:subtilisin family serine protease
MAHLRLIKLANAILTTLTLNLISFPTTAQVTPKGYIVVLQDGINPLDVAVQHGSKYGFNVPFTYDTVISGYAARIPEASLSAIKNDPRVLFISEDRPVYATAQTLPTGVDRMEGDRSSTKSGDGTGTVNVAVAVIDTGIKSNHPDLNVVGGKNCVLGGINYEDQNGHGTHVAGTVAAKDNTEGVVGVAPGASLYAVRVLDAAGSGTTSQVICGIDWVTKNAASKGIKVVNMSLGGTGSDDGNCGNTNNDAMHKAICKSVAAGVTYVVAAGNDNKDFATTTPAAYNEVLTVTAMADFNGQPGGGAASTCRSDVDDTAADFSNYTTIGSSDVNHTIAAPGVCIYSTWLNTPLLNNGYNTISGTSMASPHVAGAAALCIASGSCAGMTPQQLVSKLRSDAAAQPASYGFQGDPNSPIGNRYYGNLVYAGGY